MARTERITFTKIELTTTLPDIPIQEFSTERAAARAAAQTILTTVIHKPDAAIMFATGNTMIPVYEELVHLVEATKVDFSQIQAFHLDEYDGASPDDAESFVGYLRKRVFDPLSIPQSNRHEMRGDTGNSEQETIRYNDEINKQPMDLVILGIGPGGHMAFNEPGTPFAKQTHITSLSEETRARDIKRGQSPHTHALTVGIANILQAKQAIMIGFGEKNGKEFANVVHGPLSESCPASALQRISDRVSIICDTSAALAMRSA